MAYLAHMFKHMTSFYNLFILQLCSKALDKII